MRVEEEAAVKGGGGMVMAAGLGSCSRADGLFNAPSAHGDSRPAPRGMVEKMDRGGGPPGFVFDAELDFALVCWKDEMGTSVATEAGMFGEERKAIDGPRKSDDEFTPLARETSDDMDMGEVSPGCPDGKFSGCSSGSKKCRSRANRSLTSAERAILILTPFGSMAGIPGFNWCAFRGPTVR